MKLKSKVEDINEIPEKFRELYTEHDGAYWLDAEGIEDTSGLKKALEAERRNAKEASKKLKEYSEKYSDLDPESAREAMKKVQELDDKRLMDAKQYEELNKRQLERLAKDHEAKMAVMQKSLDGLLAERDKTSAKLKETLLEAKLQSEFSSAGMIPDAIPIFMNGVAKSTWQLNDANELVPMENGDIMLGPDARPLSPRAWIEKKRADASTRIFFPPSQGGGATNRPAGSNPGIVTMSRQIAKENPQQYNAAKAQAEKAGARLELVE